ncbi:MAG: formate C-acetyltransferase/glycerol dehydratase family glycyl radical enzyme [Bacteroidales bacterium]|nr:formate C-acetyltransferase/glycerol dehydratase family glycyl radical enzyme [Bacteroidales bacterium]
MTERINILREQSLNAVNSLSEERAILITDFYKNHVNENDSVSVQRAKGFRYIMLNKKLNIIGDELIVGERGSAPKVVPTYPEITLHSLKDLDILNSREKVSYKVSNEMLEIYEKEIIPFWRGKSQRERIMTALGKDWHNAYESGIFTEFQEQRTPGHTVAGGKIYQVGILEQGTEDWSRTEDSKAMRIAGETIIEFAGRYGIELKKMANAEPRGWRAKELLEMAEICERVPAKAPRTFHEAIQYYWFMHIGVVSESNPWDSFNPGRLDQHLYPFYKKELEAGTLTKERAVEILQSFWIKFNNHPAPPKVGITAEESNTYTDFALINLGGLTAEGEDAVNELSYIILDVIEEMRILQPGSMVQVSKKNPDEFLQRALKIVKTGFGQPSIFNTDMIIEELVRQGKDIVDARNGGASGCVESGAFGTEAYILTGYFNLTKVLEICLNDGVDPQTGRFIGIRSNPLGFGSFADLMKTYVNQLEHFLEVKMSGNLIIDRLFAMHIPVPFLSLLIDDCVENAKDYNRGGARYNTSYIQGVGFGSLTDSLTAIKYHVFDKQSISLEGMLDALRTNFENHSEFRHELIYNTPKYGNDDDYADDQSVEVFESFFNIVDGKTAFKENSKFRINMLPTTSHIYFGNVMGATSDGRKAQQPLSEGISPFQGADKLGPTAVIKSASKIDHSKTGGTLLNQKFTPQFFENDEAIQKLGSLVRAYFKLGGHHIQFNVVSSKTLKDAQKHPEKYQNLIVRVAGYSDYFNDLGIDLQDEIIRRTEHSGG